MLPLGDEVGPLGVLHVQVQHAEAGRQDVQQAAGVVGVHPVPGGGQHVHPVAQGADQRLVGAAPPAGHAGQLSGSSADRTVVETRNLEQQSTSRISFQ